MGFEIEVVRGPHAPREADLLFPQVDLSVLPAEYRAILDAHPRVVNRRVVDIRKSTFSANLLRPGDAYRGPVLVKTNANYGGIPEVQAQARKILDPPAADKWRQDLALAQASLATTPVLHPKDYPVFPGLEQVPPGVFDNPHLVVEKFLPEREGDFYFLRSYAFLGTEAFTVRTRSKDPVIKGSNGSHLEFVPVDEAIVAAREEMGFECGKFDYVMHEGRAVLLDINATPTFGRIFPPEVLSRVEAILARGLSQWYPELTAAARDGNAEGP